ncbi:hypothetical protein J4225_02140 [Candidatus Pacearchaeota archaeon]|nr:hypothetical protein [Candidatus Pacearchaeota archaeon]
MAKKRFLRRLTNRYLKLGKKRKKKQKWRKPKGRHNKMREKERGYPAVVSIGYRKNRNERGLIKNQTPVEIKNLSDIKKIGKNKIAVLGRIGKKNRIDIAKAAEKEKVTFANFNVKKFLKKLKEKTVVKEKPKKEDKTGNNEATK